MKAILTALVFAAGLAGAASAQIATRVQRTTIAGVDVMIYPTGVKDVVTIKGSLPAGDALAGDGNAAIPSLTGMLLDQGTTKQDKFAIAEKLESVGASINFSVGQQLSEVSAKCLAKDVPLVIGLIAEQLRHPALTAEEFEKAKAQFAGQLQRSLESTDARAGEAFARAVYSPGHPNRVASTEEYLAALPKATLAEVKAFHAKYYGPARFTLVLVGDVDAPAIQKEISAGFTGWTGGVDYPHPAKSTGTDAARDQTVFMADKTSISVTLGQASGLRYSDPDYQALRVGTAILGSGFTGRLMGQVRDVEGLTYGIGSRLANDSLADGDWRITATFAPSKLDQGLVSTRRELNKWFAQGATDKEVANRKTNLIGTFKVGLATTDGMAGSLLTSVQRGFTPAWLDDYPRQINSLTTAQVNGAIKKHLDPEKMVLVKAGTVTGAK
ncbi:MAG: insulinase family protein [Opitutus sp.]|nr:insulinase family protein [Opitutus sp.]